MIRHAAFCLVAFTASSAWAAGEPDQHPGLSGRDWSCAQTTSASVQVLLTNEGLIDQNKVDDHKTNVKLLAKELLPKGETRQVFLLTLHETGGRTLEVITVSKTGAIPGTKPVEFECPFGTPSAYVVSKEF